MTSLHTSTKSSICSSHLEKSLSSDKDPAKPKKKKINGKKKISLKREKGKENIGEHSATEDFCFTDEKTIALKDYLPGPRSLYK